MGVNVRDLQDFKSASVEEFWQFLFGQFFCVGGFWLGIERLLTVAGNDPSKAPPRVTLHCPKCRRTKLVLKDETDPEGTAKVEVVCNECDDGGGFPGIHYYDAAGRWFDGETFRTLKTR